MRVRLATSAFRLEFSGPPAVWNEFLRPIFGGPEAPPDPVPAPAPVVHTAPPAYAPQIHAAAAPLPANGGPAGRTFVLPRRDAARDAGYGDRGPAQYADSGRYQDGGRGGDGNRSGDGEWRRRRGGPEPTIPVEPAADPRVLYARLGTVDSRRAEKDAILAAVWFVGRGQRDVSPEEVEQHLREHGGPEDVKVRPHMQKHITRTKLMEPGETNGWVRLSPKGRAQIRLLVGE